MMYTTTNMSSSTHPSHSSQMRSDEFKFPAAEFQPHPTAAEQSQQQQPSPSTTTSSLNMPIKLDYGGECAVLLLHDASYESLLNEIIETTDLSASEIADRSKYHLYFTDTAGDKISVSNTKSFHNALLVLGHSDPELLHKQGIKLFLTKVGTPSSTATTPSANTCASSSPRSTVSTGGGGQVDQLASSLRALGLPEETGKLQIVHPKYKTEECKDFIDGHCGRGARCSFLHPGEDDLVAIENLRRSSATARQQVTQLNRYLGINASQQAAPGLLYSRPCNFYFTAQGCTKGKDCTFSHDAMNYSERGPSTVSNRSAFGRGWSGGATSGFKSLGGRGRGMVNRSGMRDNRDNFIHEHSAAAVVDEDEEQD